VHSGKRKDKITPEFAHQMQIALYLTTIALTQAELVVAIIAAFAHDLFEDYPQYTIEIVAKECGYSFQFKNPEGLNVSMRLKKGLLTALTLSKIRNGKKLSNEEYFKGISEDMIAALVKGADRINNFQSMVGVFNIEKIKQYLKEGMEILACLKAARRKNPSRASAFFNVEHMLKSQIELVSLMLDIHPARRQVA